MGKIPQETVQRIIDENDIVDVIGGYFEVKRAGGNYRALCPFHTENTPSFNINPQRQIYHCFGCGVGGDVIRFVMEYENLPFPDAAKKLADRAGIRVEETAFDAEEDKRHQARRDLQRLHKQAAEWFHKLLFKSADAQIARDYLKGRDLGMETARRWQFGYAPGDSNLFINWARDAGFKARTLATSGLAAWRDENNPSRGLYSRFRDRLMFPINNDFGDVIAFSGRVLLPDQKGGKYINSPETPLFNKSRVLFGLDKAKQAIRREKSVVICEGQIDLIVCSENGIENIVAPLGTACTEHHARLLKRHTDLVIMCNDGDTAGRAATVKAFQHLAGADVLVKVVDLPQGADPDSFIAENGADALRERIANARDIFDYMIEARTKDLGPDSLRERMQFAQEIADNIALTHDKVLQDSLINQVAVRLGVGVEEIRRLVGVAVTKVAADKKRGQSRKDKFGDPDAVESVNGQRAEPLQIRSRKLRFLCRTLLTDAAVRNQLTSEDPPEFLRQIADSQIVAKIWRAEFDAASPSSVSAFSNTLEPAEQAFVNQLLAEELPEGTIEHAQSCLAELERDSLKNRISVLQTQLRTPGLPIDRQGQLLTEIAELSQRLAKGAP